MAAKKSAAFIREILLVLLVIASLSLITLTIRETKKGIPLIITALAAVGSSLSAIGALYISVRNQSVDRERRRDEKLEQDEKRSKARKAVTSLYAAEISAWLMRKDLGDFCTSIDKVRRKEDLQAAPLLHFQLQSRDSIVKISGPQAVKPNLIERIAETSQQVCFELALPAFDNFSAIPSIWTTQFKRDDIDLLGEAAPVFFVAMSAVWTNLTLSIKQIPSAEMVSNFLQTYDASNVKEYIEHLADYIGEVGSLFGDFLEVARRGMESLAAGDSDDPLKDVKIPVELVGKSRDASPGLAEIYNRIAYQKSLDRVRQSTNDWEKMKSGIAAASDSVAQMKNLYAEIHAAEQASLDKIKSEEKSGDPDTGPIS